MQTLSPDARTAAGDPSRHKKAPVQSFDWLFNGLRQLWQQERWLYASADSAAAELRARHVEAVLRVMPLVVLAHMLNAALVVLALRSRVPLHELLAWCAVMLLTCLLPMRSWLRWRTRVVQRVAPAAIWRATLQAAWMAALWAVVPLLWIGQAEPTHALLLSVLISGVMCAGAFIMATLLPASLAHVAVLGAGAIAALLRTGDPVLTLLSAMIVIYMAVVVAGVRTVGRLLTRGCSRCARPSARARWSGCCCGTSRSTRSTCSGRSTAAAASPMCRTG